VFYRDVLAGRYDITIPNRGDYKYQSAHFDLAAGQQALRQDHLESRQQRNTVAASSGLRWRARVLGHSVYVAGELAASAGFPDQGNKFPDGPI
jgi:hypothetical protein